MATMFDNMNEQGVSSDSTLSVKPVKGVRKVGSIFSGIAGALEGFDAAPQPASLPFKPTFAYNAGAFLQGLAEGMGRAGANAREKKDKEFAQGQDVERTNIAKRGAAAEEDRLKLTREGVAYQKQRDEQADIEKDFTASLQLQNAPAHVREAYRKIAAGLRNKTTTPEQVSAAVGELAPYLNLKAQPENVQEYFNRYLSENPDMPPREALSKAWLTVGKLQDANTADAQIQAKIRDLTLQKAKRESATWSRDEAMKQIVNLDDLAQRGRMSMVEIGRIVAGIDRNAGDALGSAMQAFGSPESLQAIDVAKRSPSKEVQSLVAFMEKEAQRVHEFEVNIDELKAAAGIRKVVAPTITNPSPPASQTAPAIDEEAARQPIVETPGWVKPIAAGAKAAGGALNYATEATEFATKGAFGLAPSQQLNSLAPIYIKAFKHNDPQSLARIAANINIPVNPNAKNPSTGEPIPDTLANRIAWLQMRWAKVNEQQMDKGGNAADIFWQEIASRFIGDEQFKELIRAMPEFNKVTDRSK